MSYTSSQGNSLISGATKVSMKASRSGNANTKLDSSTLSLAHGSTRTYEDGLADLGSGGSTDGITVTVSASGLGTKPAVGSTVSAFGKTCKCTESTQEADAGALAAWSASYSSDA